MRRARRDRLRLRVPLGGDGRPARRSVDRHDCSGFGWRACTAWTVSNVVRQVARPDPCVLGRAGEMDAYTMAGFGAPVTRSEDARASQCRHESKVACRACARTRRRIRRFPSSFSKSWRKTRSRTCVAVRHEARTYRLSFWRGSEMTAARTCGASSPLRPPRMTTLSVAC